MKQILMMMVAVVLVGCGTTKVDLDASEPSSEPSIGIVTANVGAAYGKPTVFTRPIFRLKQGELLNILEEVTLDKPKGGEPRKWYRVQIPVDRKEEVQRIRASSPAGPQNGFAYVPALHVTRQSKATNPPQDKP